MIYTETIKTPQIHIIGIIEPISNEILQKHFAHDSRVHKIPNVMLASKHWSSNLASLLTSTYPSYHGIWTAGSEQKLGMHATPLTKSFQNAYYNPKLISTNPGESLLLQMGFTAGEGSRAQKPQDEVSIDLITSLTDNNIAEIHTKIIETTEQAKKITLLIQLESPNLYTPIPAYFALSKRFAHPKIGKGGFHGIVDIAPSIFKWLGLKAPYPWVGQSLEKPREYNLIEEKQRMATIITPEYRMTIDNAQKGGQFYHLPSDPEELRNLWDDESYTAKKMETLLTFSSAQLGKEPMPMPRIAGA